MVAGIVERAIISCAEEYQEGNVPVTLRNLQRGRRDLWHTFMEHVSDDVAALIGEEAEMVQAVYRYVVDPTRLRAQQEPIGHPQKACLNLVVWGNPENAVLNEFLQDLKNVLTEQFRDVGLGLEDESCLLNTSVVGDQEVQNFRGLGVVPGSEVIRTSQIWPPPRGYPRSPVEEHQQSEQEKLLDTLASFDPKLAPENRILKHARAIEDVPPQQRGTLAYHLMELKVNLIRKIISDQLSYINIAKNWFTTQDLADLHRRRIGYGRIGGKAAGMMLAARILEEEADEEICRAVRVPESYFLGSDLIYIFMAMNGLMHWNDQKYKPEQAIREEHQQIVQEFRAGAFPPEVLNELRGILAEIGEQPLIVRSSSQLEDNFGTVFAGKYDSFFCPNQGTPQENLADLTDAIARTYASTMKPEALLYRRRKGLQDYDERMAVLIQAVQGERFGRYFLPHAAGVAFSRNLYRWSPEICREDGFVRLVWGLGTRAVSRMDDDYPRLVALSHPHLLPDDSAQAIRRYSQHHVDVIDLEDNAFKSLPVQDVLSTDYAPLKYVGQVERDGYFVTPRMRIKQEELSSLAITFDKFLNQTPFVDVIRRMLDILERHYHKTVDMEFTAHINPARSDRPRMEISLLQCRPQPHLEDVYAVRFPHGVRDEDVVFSTQYMVPRGVLHDVRYVVFVAPKKYFSLASAGDRHKVARMIGALNNALPAKKFICVGPGRWGSANTDLGVFVSYADIHHCGALVELSGEGVGPSPEPSLGTHFFQDLMEASIYPLALDLDRPETSFNRSFFYQAPNSLARWIKPDPAVEGCIRVIEVDAYRPGHHLDVIMDDERGKAMAHVVQT